MRHVPSFALLLLAAFPTLASCGGSRHAPGGDPGPAALDGSYHPAASCLVTIASPPLQDALHVPIGTDIQWDSNPPSSGEHYPIWAAFQVYDTPVPRGYYVHNLEHGAVVLLYNCPDGGCAVDPVSQLAEATAVIPDDPLCAAAGEGVRVRSLVTADPLIDVPIAAAAWGWTYTADCVDMPTLQDFLSAHYGHGPEAICANGTTEF